MQFLPLQFGRCGKSAIPPLIEGEMDDSQPFEQNAMAGSSKKFTNDHMLQLMDSPRGSRREAAQSRLGNGLCADEPSHAL